MAIPITQVDAFTDKPFAGNPAAVCVLPRAAEEAWMQNLAREMNLSETAFLVPRGDGSYDLRWFTPAVEVALCGHATLASAHVLWSEGHLPRGMQARFHTQSGLLTAERRDDETGDKNGGGTGAWIELDFPATHVQPCEPPEGLLPALGLHTAQHIARSKFDYLVEVASEAQVRALAPDHGRLRALPVRGVIATSAAGSADFDIVSRFFAPGSGVDEDPVTGSAHCALAPYWAAKLGKPTLRAYQASTRGGELRLRLAGDRVKLAGQAVTIFRGQLA